MFRKALRRAGAGVIAVPFWGRGAVKLLGLDAGTKVRVICNLDHPGCNPFVIEKLREHKVAVKTHPRLHAKIYATADIAIVGSSNASSNGLTVEGKEAQGWVELNVASGDREFVSGVLGEFEALWDSEETRRVHAADIKRAKERRANMPLIGSILPDGQALFDAVRKTPAAFADVYLAIYDDDLSRNANALLGVVQKSAVDSPSSGFDGRTLKNAWGYQFRRMPEPAWLIDISCKGKSPRYVGTARSTGLALAVAPGDDGEEQNYLTPALRGPIMVGGRLYRPNAAEKALLVRHAKVLLKKAGDVPLPLAKAVAIIDKRR